MKKSILAIALMALASISASAASIKWSSNALSFDGTVLKSNTAVKGYLIYLADGVLSPSYTVDSEFVASSIGLTVATDDDGSAKTGKSANTFTFDFGNYSNGDSFAMLVSYTEGENTWYNLSSVVNEITGLNLPNDNPTFTEFVMNGAMGTDPTLTAGGGWVKALADAPGPGGDDPTPGVPEPATGALALAGLALLFRRKRA